MTTLQKEIESVGLVGLGALGCAYLGKIAETIPMQKIQVLADGARAERYRKNGVLLNGRRIDFPVSSPEQAYPVDLLIFTVKYTQLEDAIRLARPAVGPDTLIISLLNGIGSSGQCLPCAGGACGHRQNRGTAHLPSGPGI